MITKQWRLAVATVLLAPLASHCSLAAYAQSPSPDGAQAGASQGRPTGQWRGPHGQQELRMLTRVLNLTPDQQTGVKAVLDQRNTQMMALRNKAESQGANSDAPETRQARMTQMDKIREESNTKIAAQLDDNQKKTFTDWVQERKAEMARRRSHEGNPPPSNDSGAAPNEN